MRARWVQARREALAAREVLATTSGVAREVGLPTLQLWSANRRAAAPEVAEDLALAESWPGRLPR